MKESEKKSGSGVTHHEAELPPHGGEVQASASGGVAAEEQIRMRAYELYREGGGKVGDDMANWLQAEREYLERAPRTTADPAGQWTSALAPSATHG
jgi:hypothetical protein